MLAIPLRQLIHDHDFAGRTEQLVDKPDGQQLHLQASSVNTVAPKKRDPPPKVPLLYSITLSGASRPPAAGCRCDIKPSTTERHRPRSRCTRGVHVTSTRGPIVRTRPLPRHSLRLHPVRADVTRRRAVSPAYIAGRAGRPWRHYGLQADIHRL